MKKLVSIFMSIVFIFSFSLTAFAKQNENGKPAAATEHKNDKEHVNDKEHGNGGKPIINDKKLSIVDKKLDIIEGDLNKVTKQIDEYLNSTTGSAIDTTSGSAVDTTTGSTTDTTTGSAVGTTTGSATDTTSGSAVGTTTGSAVDATTGNTTDATTGNAVETTGSAIDVTTGSTVTEGGSVTTTGSAVSVDEEDKDIEQEDKEFESENYGTSLIGKLNALNNRLDAIKVTGNDVEFINGRISDMKSEIHNQLSRLEGVKSNILQKLNDKLEQKEYKPAQSSVNTDKVWTIHFNKKLDSNIVNKLNIFVVDSNNDPVSVQLGYDNSTGSVAIKGVEGFKSGEAYTLFISKDVKATDNTQLKDAVKMQFTVK